MNNPFDVEPERRRRFAVGTSESWSVSPNGYDTAGRTFYIQLGPFLLELWATKEQ